MKTYDIHFQLTVEDDESWVDSSYDESDQKYIRIDPGIDQPYVCIPQTATISLVIPDGFYLDSDSRTLYHKREGMWYYWDAGDWQYSSVNDEVATSFSRINAVS